MSNEGMWAEGSRVQTDGFRQCCWPEKATVPAWSTRPQESEWRRLHQPREVMGRAKYEDRILSHHHPAKCQEERRVVLVINWRNGLFFLKKSMRMKSCGRGIQIRSCGDKFGGGVGVVRGAVDPASSLSPGCYVFWVLTWFINQVLFDVPTWIHG